ncbi:MAG TPA: HAMP domain-containing sensor histidine kinase, partial [Nitrospirota bacterium]
TKLLLRGQLPTMVEVSLSVPEELEISADKQRIQQVFLNLLSNAIDAVPEHGGHVEVSARETEGSGGKRAVVIEVSDNGTGIEPDRLKKIFDPFFTTKDVGRGSGLGLFIVYDIIERHGGTVTAESKKGAGTTFHITLPQADEEVSAGTA